MVKELMEEFKVYIAEKSGKTQLQVAEELGLTKYHLNRVLNGRTNPSVDLVDKIYDYMYGGDKK